MTCRVDLTVIALPRMIELMWAKHYSHMMFSETLIMVARLAVGGSGSSLFLLSSTVICRMRSVMTKRGHATSTWLEDSES